MSDIVSPILQWLNANPELAGLATFVISAGESVAIIGTLVPGSITMTAIGTLAGAGVIPLWPTVFWAILGAVVGDGISYWIGHYFKGRLRQLWPFKNNPGILEKGEIFVHKYGVMSVFIGRFVGPVRALVPLVAGMLGMKPLPFTIANVTSAIGWAPAYMLPGILLGAASLELPPDIALHVILVLMLIILFILLCLWFVYKLCQLIHNQINQMQNAIWNKLKQTRYFYPITILLKHHHPGKTHGQLTLAFFFLLTAFLFLSLATIVKIHGSAAIALNDAMYHLFRGLSIRSDELDTIFIDFTLLGQKEVILPVVFVLFGWLIVTKRWWTAIHTLTLGILATGSVFVIKHVVQSERPWGIFNNAETFSFPSGHTTLATTLYMGLAFLIALSFRPSRRWPIYTLGIIFILPIALSRLYLGAHWFTDVIGGLLLSMALLMFVILSFERRDEKPINPLSLLLITFVTLCITFTLYSTRHSDALKTNYAQIDSPILAITTAEWWQKNHMLPTYSVSLFGFPSQQINIEWAGDLNKIRNTLLNEGWSKPPARDLISTIHRIADIKSTEYLPMVSPQYLDKKPALILTRLASNGKGLLVIRLWDTSRILKETKIPLWVGIVATVPRSYSWLFQHRSSEIDIDASLIFPSKKMSKEWQWKMMAVKLEDHHGTTKILFIKPSR